MDDTTSNAESEVLGQKEGEGSGETTEALVNWDWKLS
jgi:hypothetical protein